MKFAIFNHKGLAKQHIWCGSLVFFRIVGISLKYSLLVDDSLLNHYLKGMNELDNNEQQEKTVCENVANESDANADAAKRAKANSDGTSDDKGDAQGTDNAADKADNKKISSDANDDEHGDASANEKETDERKGTGKDDGNDLVNENAALKEQLLRMAADFDNYRKRMIKDKADAIEYANENLLLDLLDPLDNLDRTLQAAGVKDGQASGETDSSSETDTADCRLQAVKAITDGVRMTRDSLVKVLTEKYGLASYGAAGEEFDADCHQALHSEAGADGSVKVPTIKEVYQKGYKLRGKVIRHAKVMVVTPADK